MPASSNIKSIRKALKLSQADLASLAGVKRRLILAAELNRRPLNQANEKRVARAIEKEKVRMLQELKALPSLVNAEKVAHAK